MTEVVHRAAEMLGVDIAGKPLMTAAAMCMQQLNSGEEVTLA